MDFMKVFDLHDCNYSKKLSKAGVTNVLRSCGRFLLDKDAVTLLQPYPDPMTREQFQDLVKTLKEGPQEKDLTVAFQAFDYKELGSLNRMDLLNILTSMTNKITTSEFDALMQTVEFTADKVAIPVLSKALMVPFTTIKVPLDEIPRRMQD